MADLKFPRYNYLQISFSLFLIFLSFEEVYGLRIASPSYNRNSPNIWLSEYSSDDAYMSIKSENEFKTQDQFRSELITKNGSDYVVLDVTFVIFTCQAKYPVKWTTPIPTQVSHLNVMFFGSFFARQSEVRPDLTEPINKVFKTILVITSYHTNFLSANFTCVSADTIDKNPLKSSIHVYYSGKTILEREGQTISIPMSSGVDDLNRSIKQVVLPCRPALPDTSVLLEKLYPTRHGESVWKQLSVSSRHITFDPKIGFSLENVFNSKKLLGSYRCTVNGSDTGTDKDAIVYVNVTSANDDNDTGENLPFKLESHLITSGKGTVTVNSSHSMLHQFDSMSEVWCCSGDTTVTPQLWTPGCRDHLQCEILKIALLQRAREKGAKTSNLIGGIYFFQPIIYKGPNFPKDCNKNRMFGGISVVYCHASNIDFLEEYTHVYKADANNLDTRKQTIYGTKYYSFTSYKSSSEASKATTGEKILILMGYISTPWDYRTMRNYTLAALLGRDFANSETLLPQTKLDYNKYYQPRNVTIEYGRNFYYEGEPLRIMCFGIKYFYSYGVHMRLNWKNGSKTVIEVDPFETHIDVKHIGLYGKAFLPYTDYLVPVLGKQITANMNMKSVDCFMPPWNSPKWDKATYNLKIVDAIMPKFVGGEKEEVVYFLLNDSGKEIAFKISEGLPKPNIKLSKDGKEIGSSSHFRPLSHRPFFTTDIEKYRNNDSANVVTIKFLNVTHEVHGIYKCVIENVKGKTIKTIKVVVTVKHGMTAVTIAFVCVFGLILILIGVVLGIKYKPRLKTMLHMNGNGNIH